MASKKRSAVGDMMQMGIGNLVGVGLISATAGAVGNIPAGTAHDIAGLAPALQSTALVGHNLGMVNRSFGLGSGSGSRRKGKHHHKK